MHCGEFSLKALQAILIILVLGVGYASVNHAAEVKIAANDTSEGDWFGWAVAISGDTAIVGAYQDDDAGSNSGAAYIFGA